MVEVMTVASHIFGHAVYKISAFVGILMINMSIYREAVKKRLLS